MKRLKISYLACMLAAICLLSGCKKDVHFQTSFPLEEDAIVSALEKTGLQGKISDSETESYADGHILYVVRSETETYGDSDNGVMIASVSSAETSDGRKLYAAFDWTNTDEFSWEDWKQQIAFATLLYGGFANEDDVYKVFCEKELPDSSPFVWEEELSGAHCRITYLSRSQKMYDENLYEVHENSAVLTVSIYEK